MDHFCSVSNIRRDFHHKRNFIYLNGDNRMVHTHTPDVLKFRNIHGLFLQGNQRMKVVVYGTLKKGYGNHHVLGSAELISEVIVPGFSLYYSGHNGGFPVARKDDGSSIKAELYDISSDPERILQNLDWLEAEGRMYDRVTVLGCENTFMYLGVEKFWGDFKELGHCPRNDFNQFVWGE